MAFLILMVTWIGAKLNPCYGPAKTDVCVFVGTARLSEVVFSDEAPQSAVCGFDPRLGAMPVGATKSVRKTMP
jgi:hypothetical protein